MNRRLSYGLWLLAALGCSPPLTRYEFTEVHMGVPFRVVLYAADQSGARAAARAAFDRAADADGKLSDYRTDSEVAQFQRTDSAINVSEDVWTVLSLSLRVARETNGAFDPTVGRASAAWRTALAQHTVLDDDRIASLGATIGWKQIESDATLRTVRLTRGGAFDFGGIAKGYAIDRMTDTLAALGITRVLVEAGGDLRAGDPPPSRDGWRVSFPNGDSTIELAVASQALSTSGDTEQFTEIDGARYSHLIDPRTARPLTTTRTVTVSAPTAALADAAATALRVGNLDGLDALRAAFPRLVFRGSSVRPD